MYTKNIAYMKSKTSYIAAVSNQPFKIHKNTWYSTVANKYHLKYKTEGKYNNKNCSLKHL